METGFLNLHDDEHFSTQLYDQGTVDEMEASLRTFVADEFPALEDILDDSEGSLFDIIRDGFPYEVTVTRNYDASDFWGTEQELNGDMAVLPLAVPLDGNIPKMDPRNKEDFQKMLTDWQEHIGSLQASDSEDMDVKDIVGLDMVLPKPISDHLPDDIFEDEINPLVSPKKLTSPNKITPKFPAVLGISIKSELSLDNFMECEDDEEEPEKKVFEDGAVDTENNSTEDGAVNTMNNSTEDGAVDTMNKSTEETSTDVKIEVEEDCVDVETVSEQIPVLEAKDLTSLLEQFEASEAFNTSSNTKPKPSVLDTHLYAMATQQIPAKSITSTMSPKSCTSVLSHQSIKDSLPKEVIDRIKASGRKKVIPVIPAMPSRRIVRGGTRMQDAGAALSRNKLLKIVSGGGSGESVQLDHDYCTLSTNDIELAPPPRSFYHSDASEYSLDKSSNFQENEDKVKSQEDEKIYSRLPDYYTVLAPQKVIEKNDSRSRKVNVRDEESWGENNSKKDSGLESGEVSDASEEIIASPSESVQQLGNRSVKKTINLKSSSKNSILSSSAKTCNNILSVNGKDYHIASTNINNSKIADNIQNINKKPAKEMTMVSVLKKCQVANVSKHIVSSSGANSDTVPVSEVVDTKEEKQGPKKRKLNIQEYRSRLKELDRIRGSRENSRANSPISSQTCTVSVGTSMMEDAASDMKNGSSNSGSVAENNITSEPVISVINQKDSLNRPEMQSVEVQTLPENEVPTVKETEKEKKEARNRERRRRQYRSRRATSSSSNGSSNSSSSSSSRNYRRRRTNSRSTQRRKRSWRRSSPGVLSSSSVSRGHSIWSRSPSSDSNGSSCSSYSSRSRSRSRSSGAKSSRRSPSSRKWRHYEVHDRDYRRSGRNYSGSRGWRRSRSPVHSRKNLVGDWQLNEREKQRQVEERRVIYVGRIEEGTSKAELRKRFEAFGPIVDISVHFREHGDNYGFVTYHYKVDAYDAVEHGNDNPDLPHYDLCFGGRRAFCKTRYADLDGMATKNDPLANSSTYSRAPGNAARSRSESEDFDVLLREAKATIRKRKV